VGRSGRYTRDSLPMMCRMSIERICGSHLYKRPVCQCVVVGCSEFQSVAVSCSGLQWVVMCCSGRYTRNSLNPFDVLQVI